MRDFTNSGLSVTIFALIFGLSYIATVPPTSGLCADLFGKASMGRVYGWVAPPAVCHRGALAALADLPEEKLGLELDGGIFQELYAVDTYDHFREHIAQVLSWRKRLENM